MMMTRDDSGAVRRSVMVADTNHVTMIVAVVVTCWVLITALLVIENNRKDRDLALLVPRAYDEGHARGRIESIEMLMVQMDQRVQAAELALGLKAAREERAETENEGLRPPVAQPQDKKE